MFWCVVPHVVVQSLLVQHLPVRTDRALQGIRHVVLYWSGAGGFGGYIDVGL